MTNFRDRAAGWVAGTMDWFSREPKVATETASTRSPWWGRGTGIVMFLILVLCVVSWFWSRQPDVLWVNRTAQGQQAVVGYSTADTVVRMVETVLEKPGGYLTNDVLPPGVVLDNLPNWEQGVMLQVKDLTSTLRNHYSRSQSQSPEDKDLAAAEPQFYFNPNRWILPSAESQYRKGARFVASYRDRLTDTNASDAQFYARADNLREWLVIIEKRLGSYSQKLSSSVGESRVNTDLAGDPAAENSTPRPDNIREKTPWLKIDDHLFEARGYAWALVAALRAAEFDFAGVLEQKNAEVSLRQIIRELEASLEPLGSPMVLNGSGYGIFANHSLVMASYLSRANAGVINLRELLDQG
ncbi:MAG: DUF2333 family protein [Gammaproteobacteria bacterium]